MFIVVCGRGKFVVMGIVVVGVVEMGYVNIFVIFFSFENLKIFFEFIFKGFDVFGYKEYLDYDFVEFINFAFGKCIVRVNVTRRY